MELRGEPEKKKEPQESEDERWARLDKRIERARARHELARPVMGTIFLYSRTSELRNPRETRVFVSLKFL